MLPLELGELGGEGAHDAAGRVVGQLRGRLWRMVSLLGPQLLDASAELGGPVEEVERDSAVWARPRKVMGCPQRIISRRPFSARAWAAALLQAAAWRTSASRTTVKLCKQGGWSPKSIVFWDYVDGSERWEKDTAAKGFRRGRQRKDAGQASPTCDFRPPKRP